MTFSPLVLKESYSCVTKQHLNLCKVLTAEGVREEKHNKVPPCNLQKHYQCGSFIEQ